MLHGFATYNTIHSIEEYTHYKTIKSPSEREPFRDASTLGPENYSVEEKQSNTCASRRSHTQTLYNYLKRN